VEEFLDSPAPAVRVPTLIVVGRLDEVRQGRGDQGQEKSSVNSELHIGRRCRVAWYENSVDSAIQQDVLASFYTSPFQLIRG